MKSFKYIVCLFAFAPSLLLAQSGKNGLVEAYQREILFLSSYKKELQSKISKINQGSENKKQEARKELVKLERKLLGLQAQNERFSDRVDELEVENETKSESKNSLVALLDQAKIRFGESYFPTTEPLSKNINLLFSKASENLSVQGKVKKMEGEFFLENGEQARGEIVSIGDFTRFAVKEGKVAALFPVGNGAFKVWQWLGEESSALTEGQYPETLSMFLYEDSQKEFLVSKEKTWVETVQSGGVIAWFIVFLGLFAFILAIARLYVLYKSRLNNSAEMEKILEGANEQSFSDMKDYCLSNRNSVTRVVGRALPSIHKEEEILEDIIVEAIVKETQTIDRFNVFIIIIASIAPLLGLLGTVTGMISTFDVITTHGTGNPKLLSGGISEALVTTMLGLIVAIPTLFIGHFLTSLNESIRSDMEKWSLAVCNKFRKKASS